MECFVYGFGKLKLYTEHFLYIVSRTMEWNGNFKLNYFQGYNNNCQDYTK